MKATMAECSRFVAIASGRNMAPLRTQDHVLLAAPELALIQSSSASTINDLSLSRIQSHVTRTKRDRDKYRDLTQRQHRTKKGLGKGPARPLRSLRTARNVHLFVEALKRFEKRQAQLAKQGEQKQAKKRYEHEVLRRGVQYTGNRKRDDPPEEATATSRRCIVA
jgi:hypothetical protein